MDEKPAKPSLTRDQLQSLVDLARETRSTEYAFIRLLLTVSGGALALSIGFALGDRRVPIPPDLIPYLRGAWLALIVSMGCALLSAATTSLTLTIASKLLSDRITEMPSAARWSIGAADILSTVLAGAAVVICIAGLAYLAFVALQMAGN